MKDNPIIHSLLSLPCYRILEQEYKKGFLECNEGQIQFRNNDRLYSIPFHHIENVELRSLDSNPHIIFLTHVGLIIFYFYQETSLAQIHYMYDSITRMLNTKEREIFPSLYTIPIRINQKNTKVDHGELLFFEVHFSLRTSTHIYTYKNVPSSFGPNGIYSLPGHSGNLTLKTTHSSKIAMFIHAIKDGGILGIWNGQSRQWFGRDVLLVLSKKNQCFVKEKIFLIH